MSVLTQARGDLAGVAAHLQCPHCGYDSKSHAHQLSHIAASHPTHLDGVAFGRLGNILMYQSTANLFHCFDCFFTSKDFTKVYKHVITKHCLDEREAAPDETAEKAGEKDGGGAKREQGSRDEDATAAKRSRAEREGGEDGAKPPKGGEGREEAGEEGRGEGEGAAPRVAEKADGERDESVLIFDGASFRCAMCSWKSKLKGVAVNHVVRKHDVPRAYAVQAIKRDAAAEDDEASGLNSELLRVEMEATAKVISFAANRFVCQICGWKTKLKGLAITHVERSHEVERPYGCRDCPLTFFLPSRLQQHMTAAHRPGRYVCPFCCFRSHFLGGFKRHCSRCNAWGGPGEGGEARLGGGGGAGGAEGEKERSKEEEGGKKGGRTRRKTAKLIKAEEDAEEDEDED